MTTSHDNLICVWYPNGGFGNFVNAILVSHGSGYAKSDAPLVFSSSGDSHAFPLILPVYHHNPTNYQLPRLDPDLCYTVLIDNGINDESTRYRDFFPGARTLKMCYSDRSWPIVARTMIEKSMHRKLSDEVYVDPQRWSCQESWAEREKYFLYLRDHPLRHCWRPDAHCHNVMVEDLMCYDRMLSRLCDLGLENTFHEDWQRWKNHNQLYLSPVEIASEILQHITDGLSMDLFVEDLWTQAVVNYFIWLEYTVEVPANDYSLWFTNTSQIVKMLNDHGVKV